jgi:four helix bundle protein
MEQFEFDFEKLKVYQKSLDFIDKTFKVYRELSQDHKIAIGSNWVRAALSIANNIAEGNDKDSDKERIRYFAISSDSARECVSVLNVLKRQNLINEGQYVQMRNDAREITSMLKGLRQ